MTQTTYQVTVCERMVRVHLRRDGERVFVRLDDRDDERSVRLGTVHGPLRSMRLGDRVTELLAVVAEDVVTLVHGGLELRAEVVDEARARLTAVTGGRVAGHARRELRAPMPGLLVKVLCQPGDSVAAGQPLVVLQAMKMENELSLPRGGTIASVAVEPGQSIEQGQVILVVE